MSAARGFVCPARDTNSRLSCRLVVEPHLGVLAPPPDSRTARDTSPLVVKPAGQRPRLKLPHAVYRHPGAPTISRMRKPQNGSRPSPRRSSRISGVEEKWMRSTSSATCSCRGSRRRHGWNRGREPGKRPQSRRLRHASRFRQQDPGPDNSALRLSRAHSSSGRKRRCVWILSRTSWRGG